MAKAKKTKPVKVKKPMDPETAARLRRIGIHLTATVLFVGGLGATLFFDREYVEHKVTASPEPPKVVLKNRPVWMSDFLAEQIARTAQPNGTHSVFDHQLLVDTRELLKANPWIADVRQIRRAYGNQPGDTLEIDCDYRAPVALVHWKDYYWLVDGAGVKLPEAFAEPLLPKIMFGQDHKVNIRVVEGVQQPPPESGAKWAGDDLKAGLELVKLLYGRPYAEEVERVNVANYGGRHNAKDAQLVLVTKYKTNLRWGRPISTGEEDFFVEATPAQKLKYMESIYNEMHRVDANYEWVDLRFDLPTRPSSAPAQTATAQIR